MTQNRELCEAAAAQEREGAMLEPCKSQPAGWRVPEGNGKNNPEQLCRAGNELMD